MSNNQSVCSGWQSLQMKEMEFIIVSTLFRQISLLHVFFDHTGYIACLL